MYFSAVRKAKIRTACLLASGAMLSAFNNAKAQVPACCYPDAPFVRMIENPRDAVVCPGEKASFVLLRRSLFGYWRLNGGWCGIWITKGERANCLCFSDSDRAAGCSRSRTIAVEIRDECDYYNGTCAVKGTVIFPEYSTYLNGTLIDFALYVFGGTLVAISSAARLIYRKIEIPVSNLEATVHLCGVDLHWQPGWSEPEVSDGNTGLPVLRMNPPDTRYLVHITDLTDPDRAVPCDDCEYFRDSHYTFVPDFDQACHNFSLSVTQDICHPNSTSLYAPAENPPTVFVPARVSAPPEPASLNFQLLPEQQSVLVSWVAEAFTRYNLAITDVTNSSDPIPVPCKGCLSMGASPYKFTPEKGTFRFRFAMTAYNCMGVGDTAEVEIVTMISEQACPSVPSVPSASPVLSTPGVTPQPSPDTPANITDGCFCENRGYSQHQYSISLLLLAGAVAILWPKPGCDFQPVD